MVSTHSTSQGVQQIPLDGVSMVYTWNNATAKDGVTLGVGGRAFLLRWGEFSLCRRCFFSKMEFQKSSQLERSGSTKRAGCDAKEKRKTLLQRR